MRSCVPDAAARMCTEPSWLQQATRNPHGEKQQPMIPSSPRSASGCSVQRLSAVLASHIRSTPLAQAERRRLECHATHSTGAAWPTSVHRSRTTVGSHGSAGARHVHSPAPSCPGSTRSQLRECRLHILIDLHTMLIDREPGRKGGLQTCQLSMRRIYSSRRSRHSRAQLAHASPPTRPGHRARLQGSCRARR